MMSFVSKVQSQGLIILGWYLPITPHVSAASMGESHAILEKNWEKTPTVYRCMRL